METEMSDYETDYDDDGNPILVKITKAVLKERLAAANEQLAAARQQRTEAWAKATAAENRAAAWEFGHRLGAAIGDQRTPFAVQASLNVDHDTVEVGVGTWPIRVPGAVSAHLNVEFHGEPEALRRLGEALVQR